MAKRTHLSRRDFLKVGGATSLGLVLSACRRAQAVPLTDTPLPPTAPIATPSPTPRCLDPMDLAQMPPPRGERYSATIPDTLDLQQRAALVLDTMTSCTDAKGNYAPYDNVDLWRNPPVLRNTTMFNGKYMEATALLRSLTGSVANRHVDETWRRLFLDEIIRGAYPWWGVDGGRLLAWLGDNFRIEQDPCWQELGKRAVADLSQATVHKDGYCYYPDEQGAMPTGWDATFAGWVLQGLTRLYSTTGNSHALELASEVARYLKDHAGVFGSDAHFLARHPSANGPALHFHHNGNALEGIAAYALAANDNEFASFARSGYEWARSYGSALVGFFPEYVNDWPDDRPYVDCETCCTADMIQLAMTLSQARQGDYWDDVDRYVRNQFAEMQLLDSEWIDRMVAELPPTPPEANEDADRVSERLVGSFASWASANDWYIERQPGTTFCCIGNGGRALYYVWEKMIELDGDTLRIHLLFNRASPWADVISRVPYEGQVDLVLKAGCNVEIRIPEWVESDDVACLVNGTPRQVGFRGRYAQVGYVETGDALTVTFPIQERTVETIIGDVSYMLIIKGNDVVSIDPPGKWYPFYRRSHYRENTARWVTRERFVPAL
jgi:hypothetical protein